MRHVIRSCFRAVWVWRRVRPAIRKVKVIPTKAICVVARSEVERRTVVVSSSRRILVVVETCPTSSETTFQSVLADLPPAADCVYSNARCDILAPADWLVVLMIANERCFPYVYTPETGVPWYLRYSAEGQSYWSAARHALAYYLKSRRKKFSAPVEELEHFRNQRELMRGLVELDGGGSAAWPAPTAPAGGAWRRSRATRPPGFAACSGKPTATSARP